MIMSRPVYLATRETSRGDTQWAVRVGEETWTEVSRKEGEERGRTVLNGGVVGGWWGWGAKAQGPLHRGPTAGSGAAVPPGETSLGNTARTDEEVEQFNAKYIKDYPAYKEGRCEDYAYQVLGWLVGQGNLLENILEWNTRNRKEGLELEVYKDEFGEESEEEEQINGNYMDDSEDDDPTYTPQTDSLEIEISESEDDTEIEIYKRKRTDEEDYSKNTIPKRRKPSADNEEEYLEDLDVIENESEEREELQEKFKRDKDNIQNSVESIEEVDEYEDGEDGEEEDMEGEEEEEYLEEENDSEDEESSFKAIKLHNHTKEIEVQTEEEEESSSNDEDEEESSLDVSHDYNHEPNIMKEKKLEDDESGYSTHDQSLDCENTPAA